MNSAAPESGPPPLPPPVRPVETAAGVAPKAERQAIRLECLKVASSRMNTYNAAQDTAGLITLAAQLETWVTR